MVNIEMLQKQFFSKGKPVVYNLKCGEELLIYPILVDDWDLFEACYNILTIEKNKTPSPEIIKMSYLKFLLKAILPMGSENDINDNHNRLYWIFKLCCNTEKVYPIEIDDKSNLILIFDEKKMIEENINGSIVSVEKLVEVEKVITEKEFDEIRKIILFQNIPNYDDTEISEDVKNLMEEYFRLSNGDLQPVTLEDKLIFLGNELNTTTDKLLNMTYREFEKRFNIAVEKMDYVINKTAELSGNVTFKKKLEHIIYKHKTNKYGQFFVDSDIVKDTIDG